MKYEEYIETLDHIMTTIELQVPYAELVYHEDVLHEDIDEVVRFIVMNRGSKEFYVSYGHNGCIYSYTKCTPRLLLLDIHNAICIALED
jgi:Tol biopolymer transport system component